MNYRKRAWRSISRRKGKSIILFAVLFILGNVIAGAISIYQATDNVEKNIKSQLGATVSLELDFEKMMASGDSLPQSPSQSTLDKLGQSSHVKYYDYSYLCYPEPEKLKLVGATDNSTEVSSNVFQMAYTPLTLKGVHYAPLLDIKTNKIQLSKGRTFTEEEIEKNKNVALVSKDFAAENNLSVGDTMVIDYPIRDFTGGESSDVLTTKETAVEIIGIFQPTTLETKEGEKGSDSSQEKGLDSGLLNTVYLPNDLVKEFADFATEEMRKLPGIEGTMIADSSATPYYELKSPDAVDAFKEEAAPFIPEGYKLSSSTDTYDTIAGPVESMKKLAFYVLVVAILATLFIITLVVLLFLRDRKHELGIYLALGERRNKIMLQILLEVLTIALVAITLAVFSGNLLAKNLSASMLETQMNNAASQQSNNTMVISSIDVGGSPTLSNEDVLSQYNVQLTLPFILLFYVVGLGTIMTACVIPLVYILRLNPKKIML